VQLLKSFAMRKIIITLLVSVMLLLVACKIRDKKDNSWAEEKLLTKTVGNISFIIPSGSLAYDDREKLIIKCQEAIKWDLKILKFPEFTDSITVQFVSSREEMKKYTGMGASGITLLNPKIIYLLDNVKEGDPPIKHELMHMILLCAWGYPVQTSLWMNEGLAAFAENQCNGYNDEQIYRFLSENNLLLPMDSVAAHFYREPEMIAYHQAAYMVQYLLSNYGMEKFINLWMQGFANFDKIYGVSFAQAESDIDKTAKHDYPNAPGIVWKKFSEGCQ
jgi:hypothetical protein